jgi:hypothetical protein
LATATITVTAAMIAAETNDEGFGRCIRFQKVRK